MFLLFLCMVLPTVAFSMEIGEPCSIYQEDGKITESEQSIALVIKKFRKEENKSPVFFIFLQKCRDEVYREDLRRAFEINFPHLYRDFHYRQCFMEPKEIPTKY